MLILGLKENVDIKSNMTLEDTIKSAKDNNGILIAPHPFLYAGIGKYLTDNVLESLDALEIHNGEITNKMNQEAANFYLKNNLALKGIGAISASDGHSFFEPGNNYSLLYNLDISNSEKLTSSLKESIKEAGIISKDSCKHSSLGAAVHLASLVYYIGMMKAGLYKKSK